MNNSTYAIARIIKRADDIALSDIQAQGLHIMQARILCEDLNRALRVDPLAAGTPYSIVNLAAI